ncbi:MAG: hypothetical protein JNK05_15700 [Myxococcales bacterium]|nr:hypothetical protein [Myxococcales bacterium]
MQRHQRTNTSAIARVLGTVTTLAISACFPPPTMQPPTSMDGSVADSTTIPPTSDGGSSVGCAEICQRISQCAAEQGEQVPVAECVQECRSVPPSAGCVQCFTGPCTTTCGGPCIGCVSEQCQMVPPTQDSGVVDTGVPCMRSGLNPRIGQSCLFDQSCGGDPLICQRFQGNINNYCTAPCTTTADCPCDPTPWACELFPGRSAVQRYCRRP